MINCPDELKITLAAARVNAGLRQEDVANELGISKATLISWEKGKTYPNVYQAERLYEIYHRPVDSIFFAQNLT